MSYFKTEQGVELFYTQKLKKGQPTLVFVHGLCCDSEYWARYFKMSSKKYGVVLVDLRGHGKSEKPSNEDAYKIENFKDDIIQLLSALKLKDYFLIGHSFGGFVASQVSGEKMPGLRGTILISTPINYADLKKSFLLEVHLSRLLPQFIYKLLQRKWHFSQEENKIFFCIKCLARNDGKIATRILENLKNCPALSKITIPHHIIIFDQDEIVKNGIQKNYKKIKILRGHHLAFISKYKEICQLIEEFIESEF